MLKTAAGFFIMMFCLPAVFSSITGCTVTTEQTKVIADVVGMTVTDAVKVFGEASSVYTMVTTARGEGVRETDASKDVTVMEYPDFKLYAVDGRIVSKTEKK